VGEGIRASGVPREDIFVTTKLDNAWHHRVTEGLDISLKQLGLDYVDLYLMHWPSPLDPDNTKKLIPNWDFVKTWSEMQKLPATGKVKAIGVSNVGVTYMKKLLNAQTTTIVPAVNQVELHPYYPCEKLVAYCQEHGVHVTGYSPLGSASLKLLEDEVIQGVSKEVGKSVGQVLLRWGVQHGWDVIPKTATPARMEENLQLDGWMLSEGQMKKLDTLSTCVKVYGDNWLPERIFFGDD
jgi:glycerol 2-dehydrogenase (NADP+)